MKKIILLFVLVIFLLVLAKRTKELIFQHQTLLMKLR